MSTKIDVATFATVLAILAVPSVVSAQHGTQMMACLIQPKRPATCPSRR
jgi:hypothetical protein